MPKRFQSYEMESSVLLQSNISFTVDELKIILDIELTLHPKSQLVDIYKFLNQASFGPTHMTPDMQVIRNCIIQEFMTIIPDFITEPIQDIGNGKGFVRVNLNSIQAYPNKDFAAEKLTELILESRVQQIDTPNTWNDIWQFSLPTVLELINPSESDVQLIEKLIKDDLLPHHSEIYRQSYTPHYRVIHHTKIEEFMKLIPKLGA